MRNFATATQQGQGNVSCLARPSHGGLGESREGACLDVEDGVETAVWNINDVPGLLHHPAQRRGLRKALQNRKPVPLSLDASARGSHGSAKERQEAVARPCQASGGVRHLPASRHACVDTHGNEKPNGNAPVALAGPRGPRGAPRRRRARRRASRAAVSRGTRACGPAGEDSTLTLRRGRCATCGGNV